MNPIVFSLTVFMFLLSQAYAQVPVTDAGSIEQQVKTQVETMTKWKIQYDQMMSQIDQAKQQYEALTGTRGLGQIMDDPTLRDYLPDEWQTVYDNVRNSGYRGLSGRGAEIYNETKIFDSCAHITVEDQRKVCEAQAVKAAQEKITLLEQHIGHLQNTLQHEQNHVTKLLNTSEKLMLTHDRMPKTLLQKIRDALSFN